MRTGSQLPHTSGATHASVCNRDRCSALFSGSFNGSAAAQTVTALTNATLIDGTGAAPQSGATIVMQGGRITAIGRDVEAARRRHRRRPRRQIRRARHHQRPRPCRAGAARAAGAPIRALRRDHDHQHGVRSGRHRRVQGAHPRRRHPRRARAHDDVPLHDHARARRRLRLPDARGRARQGRRDRRQGRRRDQGLDRPAGRQDPAALARDGRGHRRPGAASTT